MSVKDYANICSSARKSTMLSGMEVVTNKQITEANLYYFT